MENRPCTLGKYSIGVGDRFAHQARAQLEACLIALRNGIEVTPVWNKSNREHTIIASDPSSTRQAADAAVQALAWGLPYYCDADHITSQTVARFLDACDFYTIDVADFIGQAAPVSEVDAFVSRHSELLGTIELPGIDEPFLMTTETLRGAAGKYLNAVDKADDVYRIILQAKGAANFIPEISMDETDTAQSPVDLLIILAAVADKAFPFRPSHQNSAAGSTREWIM